MNTTNLLDVPISFFEYDHQRNHFGNVPTQQTTLRRIAKTRYYQPQIEAICAEPDESKQAELKKLLPAITPVAYLYHRRRDTTFAQKIRQQWPMLMGDVDQKDNPGVDMAELKKHLCRLSYVLLCSYSVRRGLWFVVRLPDPQTPDTLAAHFRYMQKLFADRFGVFLDPSKGGNPTDLRFVSHDDAPYLNENPGIMSGTYTPSKSKIIPARTTPYHWANRADNGTILQRVVRYAESAVEGQRHQALLKAATLAGGYVAAGRMDEQTAVCALETVASEWPMFTKSQKTIQDGIRFGMGKPIYADTSYQQASYLPNSSVTPPRPNNTWLFDGRLINGDLPANNQPADNYPPEWDAPNSPDATPIIMPLTWPILPNELAG